MLILGSATWSVSDKELALETGARLLELNKEVNEYISLSGTTIESEILSIMNEKAAEVTEPEPQEPELATIDWDDAGFIATPTAFLMTTMYWTILYGSCSTSDLMRLPGS